MTTKVTNLNIDTTTLTSVGTLTSLEIQGSLHAGSANLGNLVLANYFQGDGSLLSNVVVTSMAGSNVTGTVSSATVAGTVTTAAQPNITSTGSLTGLTVTGNVVLSGANVSLGAIGNAKITGGTTGQYIKTDGAGNLSFGSVVIPDVIHPFLLGL